MGNSESTYNYAHFKATDYDFMNFKGPKPGETYIDFKAKTLDGRIVALSDFLDKPIILDTGSITCPMYANAMGQMNALKEQYPEFHFLLLYVREAHPGGKTNYIKSIDEKFRNAKSTHKLYNEKREILVDSLDGKAHLLYGGMPNMTYVIGTDGIVKFRANWTTVDALKKVLLNINAIETKDYYPVKKPPVRIVIKTLLVGGFRALFEFLVNLPQLMRQHKEAGSA